VLTGNNEKGVTKKEEEMKLIRYRNNPFTLVDDLHQEINKLFDISSESLPDLCSEVFAPRLDVSEDKDNIYVEADLPGFDQKEIDVKIKADTLTISAKKGKVEEKKGKNYFRCERIQGSFYRALTLPKSVDASKIRAEYKKGVLHLALPKKQEEKEKEISVDVN
jgi:HSP20 family protein